MRDPAERDRALFEAYTLARLRDWKTPLRHAVTRVLGDREGFSMSKPSRSLEGAWGATSGHKEGLRVLLVLDSEGIDRAPDPAEKALKELGRQIRNLAQVAIADLTIAWTDSSAKPLRIRSRHLDSARCAELIAQRPPATAGSIGATLAMHAATCKASDLIVVYAGLQTLEPSPPPELAELKRNIHRKAVILFAADKAVQVPDWWSSERFVHDRCVVSLGPLLHPPEQAEVSGD